MARKYTQIYSFWKYTFSYHGPLNFADVSIFRKRQVLLGKDFAFTQGNSVKDVRDFLVPFSVFVRQ